MSKINQTIIEKNKNEESLEGLYWCLKKFKLGLELFFPFFLLSDIKIWLCSSLKASFYCRKPPGGDCVWRQTCRVNKANKLNCALPLLMCTTFDSFRGHNKTSLVNNHTTIQVLAPRSGTFSFLCPRKMWKSSGGLNMPPAAER